MSALYHRNARDTGHGNIILMGCMMRASGCFRVGRYGCIRGMDDQAHAIYLRYSAINEVNPETVNVESMLDVLQG